MTELTGFSPSWDHTLTGQEEPRRVVAAFVSEGLFELLGVRPLAGRIFNALEHADGGPRVAVVSRAFWERYFGPVAEPSGQTMRLAGELYEIVGVMPAFPLPITRSPLSQNDDRAKLWRLKELEKENQRLKRAVADLALDNLILKEASKGNF